MGRDLRTMLSGLFFYLDATYIYREIRFGHAQRTFRTVTVHVRTFRLTALWTGVSGRDGSSRPSRASNDNMITTPAQPRPSLPRTPPAAVLKRINNDNNGPGLFRLSFFVFFFRSSLFLNFLISLNRFWWPLVNGALIRNEEKKTVRFHRRDTRRPC